MNDLTLYFSEFDIPDNHALGLYRALAACRERGARRLLFDLPGVYELDPSFCAERELCISNHGFNGPHRIAVLIENMDDFEIDLGGSRLVLPGEATHIAILSSRRIAVRNVTLEDPQCMAMQVRVVAHGDGYVDTEIMQGGEQFEVRRGELICPKPRRSCNYGVELDVELVYVRRDYRQIKKATECFPLPFVTSDGRSEAEPVVKDDGEFFSIFYPYLCNQLTNDAVFKAG